MRQLLENIIDELKDLKEMGYDGVYLQDDTLKLIKAASDACRASSENGKSESKAPRPESVATDSVKDVPAESEKSVTSVAVEGSSTAVLDDRPAGPPKVKIIQKKTRNSIGIDIPEPPLVELPPGNKQEQYDWLKQRILSCPVCTAHVRSGKKVVVGSGNLDADIFFCGEAPGAEEEVQGEVFVGPAGQLLTKIIRAMGLQRSDVYIGNIMNWRPEMPNMSRGNRAPNQQEMSFCLPYLMAQLQIVQPRVIVALGASAVNGLLGQDPKRKMGAVRGHWFTYQDKPLMITYHPSFLLHRQDSMRPRRMVWEDMLKVMEKVGLPITAKQRAYFTKN